MFIQWSLWQRKQAISEEENAKKFRSSYSWSKVWKSTIVYIYDDDDDDDEDDERSLLAKVISEVNS